MNTSDPRRLLAAMLVLASVVACAKPEQQPQPAASGHQHGVDASQIAIPKGAIYTVADVQFMQGMIAHHAQAIFMSRLAIARKANSRLVRLAVKIDESQVAEVAQMQNWLVSNEQFAPDTSSYHTTMMPGMLTKEQIARLEVAKGVEFDRQFLEMMIQHHRGALQMVKELLATPRGGQDSAVSAFMNDITLVQTTEIELMREMLADL